MTEPIIESTFGGLTFSNQGGTYTIDTLDGWYSGAPIRNEVQNRPNADGAFGITRVYRGSRVITQTGLIGASSTDEAITDPWLAFAGLMPGGLPQEYTVVDASGPKTVSATLADTPDIQPLVGGNARYVLQLVARDPIKYGPEVTYSTGLASGGGGLEYELGEPSGALYYGALGNLGRVEIVNDGTADTWPTFEVTGTLDAGFTLQCLETGSVLRYDRVVPAGSTVTIDSRTGQVLVDNQSDASTYLTRDEFFSIPAGGSCTVQFNAISTSSGSPTMTATARSGWW